jgi:hypothetical protein
MGMEGTGLCEGCKKIVPIMEIKYVPKGNSRQSLCKACLDRFNGKIGNRAEASLGKKANPNIEIDKAYDNVMSSAKSGGGVEYFCKKCQYKFKSSSSKPVCGYCGSPASIERA